MIAYQATSWKSIGFLYIYNAWFPWVPRELAHILSLQLQLTIAGPVKAS